MSALAKPELLPEPWRSRAPGLSPARVSGADLRIELVYDMMAHGVWSPKHARELAAIWGLTTDGVQQYSNAASKALRLQFSPERNEEIRSVILARLWTLGEEAKNRTEEVVDVKGKVHEVRRPDMRTALAAVIGFAEVMGIKTNRHEHKVSVTELSDEQLRAKLAELVADDPGLQEKLASMGFRREVETTGTEVQEEKSK